MVQENPYFQSAYALIAAGKKRTKATGASKDLIRAAIYATNRVFLKKYLDSATGGQQATSANDAVVEAPKKATEVAAKKANIASPTPPPIAKEVSEEPKENRRIRRRSEVEQEETKAEVEELKPAELKSSFDGDIENLLAKLKIEYQQLETNIKSFTEAEKSLTEAEIKEEAAKKKAPRAKPKTSTTPKKTTAKTTASAKTTKATSTTKKTTTSKSTTTAKKATKTTTRKTATKTTKATTTAKPKTSTRKINLESMSDEDLLEGETGSDPKKKAQKELIDNFIKSEPKITPQKEIAKSGSDQEDLSKKNQVLTDDMVTENLASIMVKQGRIEKAIEIYNKLIWKFPHKKAYFAALIKDLKEQ